MKIVSKLKEKGYLQGLEFTIFIVGSRKMRIEDDFGSGKWQILAPNLKIYGFDADEDACLIANENLKQRNINWWEKHFPLALSESPTEKTLYVTKGIDCTSLYEPNHEYLQRFAGFGEHFELDFSVEIETTTLDIFCQQESITEIDFLSIDVQGAELDVVKGALHLLNKTILALELEVEFTKMYKNQPLFSDIDRFLQPYDFSLFDLIIEHPMCRRPRSVSEIYSQEKTGQLLWADALYLRDIFLSSSSIFKTQPQQLLKLACISDILDYPDYAVEILLFLTKQYGNNSAYNFSELTKFY